jgi:hypothetical protein
MSIPGVAVWAGLSGAFATLTGEISTDLGGKVLGKDVYGLDVISGEEEHAHISNWAMLSRVGSSITARFLLALYGGRFGTLVWGRTVTLDIAALILVVLR